MAPLDALRTIKKDKSIKQKAVGQIFVWRVTTGPEEDKHEMGNILRKERIGFMGSF